MSEFTSFLHSGSIGDCWASMPVMKEYYKISGKKVVLFLEKDRKATYYEGATHPTRDASNNQVMLNETAIERMIPLFMAQDYINEVKVWNGELVHVDLNVIRDSFVNMPFADLRRWYFIPYPDMACDLSKQYIFVPDSEKDFAKNKIIIGRSERYTNEHIDYSFLKPYEDEIIFSGTMREYNNFCINFGLEIQKLNDNNFLEVAQALKQSKGLISNQTQIFQIAEGLKIPRVVELCHFAPNVIPTGEDAFDFYRQPALEYYFHRINGTLSEYMEKIKNAPNVEGTKEITNFT